MARGLDAAEEFSTGFHSLDKAFWRIGASIQIQPLLKGSTLQAESGDEAEARPCASF